MGAPWTADPRRPGGASDACRKRTGRKAQSQARETDYRARFEALDGTGPVAAATRRDLERQGVFQTWMGQLAYLLAQHIDVADVHSLAGLSKEWRLTFKAATKGGPRVDADVDEFTRHRQAKS